MADAVFQPIILLIVGTAREAEPFVPACADAARAAATSGRPPLAAGPTRLTPFDGFAVAPDDDAQSFVRVLAGRSGYGRQLRLALVAAAADGYTHAVTLDRVRKHPVADVSLLLAAAAASHESVISAAPAIPPGPFAWLFRAARLHCDFWVWTQCGRFVTDSGQGYRVYPLATVRQIGTSSGSRELDVELLVKSAWLKVPIKVVHTPHASAPLASIFTPAQIVRYSWRMTVLVLQRMMFADSFLDAMHRRDASESMLVRIRHVVQSTVSLYSERPIAFAAAVGVGTFVGVVPLWGVQMLLAGIAAHLLRVSKRVTMTASAIASPLGVPILVYGGVLVTRAIRASSIGRQGDVHVSQSFGSYAIGTVAVALLAGLLAAGAVLIALFAVRRHRPGAMT